MKLTTGKLSNYIGQATEKDENKKLDIYLVSVEKDLQNLWTILNSLVPFIGTNSSNLTTNTDSGFNYMPVLS